MLRDLLLLFSISMLFTAANAYAIEGDDAVVTTAVVDREPIDRVEAFPRQKVHYSALPGLSEQKGKRSIITSGITAKS